MFLPIGSLYFAFAILRVKLVSGRTVDELVAFISSDKYQSGIRPNATGSPLTVGISMYILALGPVNEEDMDFSLEMYYRESWRDPQLSFQSSGADHVNLMPNVGRRLWRPDTYFENAKDAEIQDVPSINILYRLYTDGTVLTSSRIQLKAVCHMDFRLFPLDTQRCNLKFSSYSMTTQDIKYEWSKEGGVVLSKDLNMNQFSIPSAATTSETTQEFIVGAYKFLVASFTFQRQISFYLSNFYVPAAMIVALSWISFWITPHSVPARVALGVITVLAITTFVEGRGTPRASYATAMDIYMFTCFTCVFMAFLEFALLHHKLAVLTRQRECSCQDSKKTQNLRPMLALGQDNKTMLESVIDLETSNEAYELSHDNTQDLNENSTNVKKRRLEELEIKEDMALKNGHARWGNHVIYHVEPARDQRSVSEIHAPCSMVNLDDYSKVLFPVLFVAFNIAYWAYYMCSYEAIS